MFWKAEPQSVGKLAQTLTVGEAEIQAALTELKGRLTDRGLRLITKDDEVTLGTAPEIGELLQSLSKQELSTELGRAGLETLTIISYRGPLIKAEVDYIRGVNSGFILRHLLVRGLIEKIPNPRDGRSPFYQPTFELLSLLGLTRVEELPDYQTINTRLSNFLTGDKDDHELSANKTD